MLVGLMVASLVAGLISLPSAGLAAPGQPEKTKPSEDRFDPGKINRTPVGGPIPDSDAEGFEPLGSEI